MEENILGITKLINALLGKPALALLSALHIQPANPQYPIPNHIAMELLVFAIAAVFFLWLRARLSVDNPGGTQQCVEALLHNSDESRRAGPSGKQHRPWRRPIPAHDRQRRIVRAVCNLISIVPGLASPTAETSVPLGCAIVVFVYYNWAGLRKHGPLGYGKHFLGPTLALSPLMVVIEAVSHLARLLSLTVRLWVNMMVSEMLYVIFLGLTVSLFVFTANASPAGYALAPVPILSAIFIILHIFVAFVQAFVFTILPVIYLSGAVAEGH